MSYNSNYNCSNTQDIYKITAGNANIPIDLAEVKKACHLDHLIGNDVDDEYLTTILNSAVACFEAISRRVLMIKDFKTFRNTWCGCYELRKSPLVSITSVKYFDEDSNEQTVDSGDYFIIEDPFYSLVQFDEEYDYQDLRPNRPQNISIDFKAGYITDSDDWTPELDGLKIAIMQHVCFMYENRGDCCDISSVPGVVKSVYLKYKIEEI